MAISDYDHLLIGPNGSNVESILLNDWQIEPYKNFLYIRNEKAWSPSSRYVSPVIGEINGNIDSLSLGPFIIHSKVIEGNSYGIQFLVREENYSDKKYNYWAGIATYGWEDRWSYSRICEVLNRQNIPLPEDEYMIFSSSARDGTKMAKGCDEISKGRCERFEVIIPEEFNSPCVWNKTWKGFMWYNNSTRVEYFMYVPEETHEWVGVSPKRLQKLKEWLTEMKEEVYTGDYGKWLDSIGWDGLNRVNPGDLFFSNELGLGDISTPVGKEIEPIAMKIIKEMK